jgi:hypothetical protein
MSQFGAQMIQGEGDLRRVVTRVPGAHHNQPRRSGAALLRHTNHPSEPELIILVGADRSSRPILDVAAPGMTVCHEGY